MNAAKRKMAIKFAGVALLLAAGLCPERVCGANIVSAGSGGFWDVAATWSPAQIPTNTDNVTITNGCTVTNRDIATHYAANLTIQTNGVLTHKANGGSEAYKVILSVATNLTIDAGGSINVDGMGYSANNGPGAIGSYGGAGSHAGPTYGSITAPTNCGSGANDWSGGGAILLIVGGTTTVNGAISAKGGENGNYSVGSGGSVFLTTGALTGNGTIRANGGNGNGFSGGGGRVAVILTNSTDFGNVTMQAYSGSTGNKGAGGTVYLENTNNTTGHGKLIVDYNNLPPLDRVKCVTMQNGIAASSYKFSVIVLTNGAVYALGANNTLDITGTTILVDPTNSYTGIYLAGGALTIPATDLAFSNYFIGIGSTNPPFNPPLTSLTVGTNGIFKVDVPCTLNGPVTVQPGGWLSHSKNGGTEAYKMNLTINGNLDIQTGAQVNVDSLGYVGNHGPGGGSSKGASYGGVGGTSGSGAPPTYGSITAPTNCGSGTDGSSGTGGGAIQLTVSGTTTVNGVISTVGIKGTDGYYGGSGGSVFLTTDTLTGNGTIRANGGTANSSGGGGRVAVILTNSTDFSAVKMQAYSGSTSPKGAAGTVYQQTQAQGTGQGTLLIDASNIVSASALITTLIGSQVTDRMVGTVVITNAAILQIDTNQSLTVNGSWTNRATFLANTNSTVILASANAATVTGSNTFWNLTCTSAVKTVVFEAGKTNTVLGQLSLKGVTLNSTVSGQYTYLTLSTNGGSQQIGAVTVQDNNAGGGQLLLAGSRSANSGHNVNWKFPASGTTFFFR